MLGMPPLLGCGSGRPFPSLVFLAMEVELLMGIRLFLLVSCQNPLDAFKTGFVLNLVSPLNRGFVSCSGF